MPILPLHLARHVYTSPRQSFMHEYATGYIDADGTGCAATIPPPAAAWNSSASQPRTEGPLDSLLWPAAPESEIIRVLNFGYRRRKSTAFYRRRRAKSAVWIDRRALMSHSERGKPPRESLSHDHAHRSLRDPQLPPRRWRHTAKSRHPVTAIAGHTIRTRAFKGSSSYRRYSGSPENPLGCGRSSFANRKTRNPPSTHRFHDAVSWNGLSSLSLESPFPASK